MLSPWRYNSAAPATSSSDKPLLVTPASGEAFPIEIGVSDVDGGTAFAILTIGATGLLAQRGPLTNGQLLIGSTGAAAVAASLTAGAGITITPGAGSITIASDNPTDNLIIGTTPISSGTSGRILFEGSTNVVQEDAGLAYDATNDQLQLPTSGSGAGILLGGDAQLYRSAADTLHTPDNLTVDNNFVVTSGTITGSANVVFNNAAQRVLLGTSTGNGGITNSTVDAYVLLYGHAHASKADQIEITSPTVTLSGNMRFSADAEITRNTTDGSDSGSLFISGGGATSQNRGANIQLYGNENAAPGFLDIQAGNVGGSAMRFVAGGGEIARITGTGLFVLSTGVIFGGEAFAVNQANARGAVIRNTVNTSYTLSVANADTTGDNALVAFFTEAGNTGRGSITYNRGGGVVAYNTTSDERAKEVSGPVTDAIARIMQFNPVRATMRHGFDEIDTMLAHEVQLITPYCVTGKRGAVDAEGFPVYQQADFSKLVPLLIAGMQDHERRLLKGAL